MKADKELCCEGRFLNKELCCEGRLLSKELVL